MQVMVMRILSITLLMFISVQGQLPELNKDTLKPNKPNIILIVADDLGFNDVPWHNKEVIAPNLESLAREGIILEQSYVMPICSPTRSALMTGTYPFAIGRQSDVIWPLMPTGLTLNSYIIPQLLKPLGYATHAVGKWHLGFCNWKYTPTERGFDTFRGYYTGSEHYFTHIREYYSSDAEVEAKKILFPSEEYSRRKYSKVPNGIFGQMNEKDKYKTRGYDFRDNRDPYTNASGVYSAYEFASRLEDIFNSSKPETPKFVYMAFQNVHSPLEVPENYTKPYLHIKDHKRRTYLGMVTAMDEAVGRLVKSLKETGNYNNTVIIFTSDNGGPTINGGNNWPLRGNKTTLWEGGTRGAAFIHSPLLPNPGTVSNNLIHVTDWMATVVNLAGGLPPSNIDGIDQWDAIVGTAKPPRKEMVYNIEERQQGFRAAIRVGDYKLLVGDPGPGEWTPPPQFNKEVEKSILHFTKSKNTIRSMNFEDHQIYIKHIKHICKNLSCFLRRKKLYLKKLKKAKLDNVIFNKIFDVLKQQERSLRSFQRNKRNASEYGRHLVTKTETNKLHYRRGTLKNPFNLDTFEDLITYEDARLKTKHILRLYNVKDDPKEKTDLAEQKPQMVKALLKRLYSYKDRYVKADVPEDDPKGDPIYWDGFWSPGWC